MYLPGIRCSKATEYIHIIQLFKTTEYIQFSLVLPGNYKCSKTIASPFERSPSSLPINGPKGGLPLELEVGGVVGGANINLYIL